MPVVIDRCEWVRPGDGAFIDSVGEGGDIAAVFEDDGDTGYFYACVMEDAKPQILDAVHIYNVADVVDKDRDSQVKIGWSPTGKQAVLLINGHPHAVFDWIAKRGWCRTGFPPPPTCGEWSRNGYQWDENCLRFFR